MSVRRWVLMALLVALGAGLALVVLRPDAGDLADLVRAGGEIVLREPMNPIRGESRVLLVALDGVGDETLRRMLAADRMPRLSGLLGPVTDDGESPRRPAGAVVPPSGAVHEHGYVVGGVLSVLPSTTWAVWPSVLTGLPPAETGTPGNEWYVREEMAFHAPGPISVEETEHLTGSFTRGHLNQAIQGRTLFEEAGVRTHVSLLPIHRGADLLTVPALTDVAAAFRAVARGMLADDAGDPGVHGELDAGASARALEGMERHGVPDLQVVYFPGIDLFTHLAEAPEDGKQAYLEEVIDPALGRVLDAYEEAGVLESTWVVLVSDHGHTPVMHDETHALGSDPAAGLPGLLDRASFRVRPHRLELPHDERDYQAVTAYQGAMAYIYLADRSTCLRPGETCSWMLPPRYEEDVLEVVRAADRANRFGEGVPELEGTLDLILAREPRPPGEDSLPFRVWHDGELIPVGEYLEREPRPDFPAFEERMRGLAEGPFGHRAGDVLLLAKSGAERPIEDRYYFSQVYASWHGSPEWRDSLVPLIVARAGASGGEIRERVDPIMGDAPTQLHVMPLVLELLRNP